MTPVATIVGPSVDPVGDESETLNPSFPSRAASATTGSEMTLLVSPIAKLTVPDGNLPPTKSVAAAAVVPEPFAATRYFTVEATFTFPSRLTVNVKLVGDT